MIEEKRSPKSRRNCGNRYWTIDFRTVIQGDSSIHGSEGFYFYDAAAPIIDKSTIDMDKVYLKSRYDKGEAAYLNCPMNEEEFYAFREALVNAEVAPLKEFEKEKFFEGCMPLEVIVLSWSKDVLFGPMKPVGLEDPLRQANGLMQWSNCVKITLLPRCTIL